MCFSKQKKNRNRPHNRQLSLRRSHMHVYIFASRFLIRSRSHRNVCMLNVETSSRAQFSAARVPYLHAARMNDTQHTYQFRGMVSLFCSLLFHSARSPSSFRYTTHNVFTYLVIFFEVCSTSKFMLKICCDHLVGVQLQQRYGVTHIWKTTYNRNFNSRFIFCCFLNFCKRLFVVARFTSMLFKLQASTVNLPTVVYPFSAI